MGHHTYIHTVVVVVVLYITHSLFVPHTASQTVHVYWSVEVVTGSLGLAMLTLT